MNIKLNTEDFEYFLHECKGVLADEYKLDYSTEHVESTDLEKSVQDNSIIIHRKSDNKCFKVEYAFNNSHTMKELNGHMLTCREVFPHVITTTVYKDKPQI